MEINLSKPLKQGFWVGDDEQRVFVAVLYEKLSQHFATFVDWLDMDRTSVTAGVQGILVIPRHPRFRFHVNCTGWR